jgi:nicotinamide-nucleotide amidase
VQHGKVGGRCRNIFEADFRDKRRASAGQKFVTDEGALGNSDCGALAASIVDTLRARGLTIAAAESCTAGLFASALVSVPGASAVFWGSYVCYAEAAKTAMLGISPALLAASGAVSAETAQAMAAAALSKSGASFAVSLTGLAGPATNSGGGGSDTPVGTVYISLAAKGAPPLTRRFLFAGNREEVRAQAVSAALHMVLTALGEQ